MKTNDLDISDDAKLKMTDLANIFHVFEDQKTLGEGFLSFDINRTLALEGVENMSRGVFREYKVVTEDTWALISYKFYGTTRLWWLVCKVNGISNPLVDPEEGSLIKVISKEHAQTILEIMKRA